MVPNYEFKYAKKDRWIFKPTRECIRKGERLISFVDRTCDIPNTFYHYAKGGHVAALHAHLQNALFFKIDIRRFYYSISRNRVSSVLHGIGFSRARTFAKWSCVKNPYPGLPSYALPIGFVQSPALATLVLMRSPVMRAVDAAQAAGLTCSVYLDDFICSGNDASAMDRAYADFLEACEAANLVANPMKLARPTDQIIAFNCVLKPGSAEVNDDRVKQFFREKASSPKSIDAFQRYRSAVASKNVQ